MAITQTDVQTPSTQIIFSDTAMGISVDSVKSSSAVAYYIIVNNSANVGAASYVKLYNLQNISVTLGTTAPDEIIYVPAGAIITHLLYTAAAPGKTFNVALSAACVTTGGTAGTTPPLSSVQVTIAYT